MSVQRLLNISSDYIQVQITYLKLGNLHLISVKTEEFYKKKSENFPCLIKIIF